MNEQISHIISSNDIVLFMKGTAEEPMCGFSATVVEILKRCKIGNASIKIVNVLDDNDIREGIKKYSNWPTIPQLYIKGEFIGGCDIAKEMFSDGSLQKIFDAKLV